MNKRTDLRTARVTGTYSTALVWRVEESELSDGWDRPTAGAVSALLGAGDVEELLDAVREVGPMHAGLGANGAFYDAERGLLDYDEFYGGIVAKGFVTTTGAGLRACVGATLARADWQAEASGGFFKAADIAYDETDPAILEAAEEEEVSTTLLSHFKCGSDGEAARRALDGSALLSRDGELDEGFVSDDGLYLVELLRDWTLVRAASIAAWCARLAAKGGLCEQGLALFDRGVVVGEAEQGRGLVAFPLDRPLVHESTWHMTPLVVALKDAASRSSLLYASERAAVPDEELIPKPDKPFEVAYSGIVGWSASYALKYEANMSCFVWARCDGGEQAAASALYAQAARLLFDGARFGDDRSTVVAGLPVEPRSRLQALVMACAFGEMPPEGLDRFLSGKATPPERLESAAELRLADCGRLAMSSQNRPPVIDLDRGEVHLNRVSVADALATSPVDVVEAIASGSAIAGRRLRALSERHGRSFGKIVHRPVKDAATGKRWESAIEAAEDLDFMPEVVVHSLDTGDAVAGVKFVRDDEYAGKKGVPGYGRRAMRVRCVEDGREWPSQKDAAEALFISQSAISVSVRTGKPVVGLHFERVV